MDKLTREEMVKYLVDHEIEVNFSNTSILKEIVRSGWKGFDNMTDDEIEYEYTTACE